MGEKYSKEPSHMLNCAKESRQNQPFRIKVSINSQNSGQPKTLAGI
jgi:hypothetical protein